MVAFFCFVIGEMVNLFFLRKENVDSNYKYFGFRKKKLVNLMSVFECVTIFSSFVFNRIITFGSMKETKRERNDVVFILY